MLKNLVLIRKIILFRRDIELRIVNC